VRVIVAHRAATVRDAARDALSSAHAEVVETDDPEEALRACDGLGGADLAVVESGMPGVVEGIARDPDRFRVPVVALVRDPRDTETALRQGAHDVLREPIEPHELRARVRAAQRTALLRGQLLARERALEELAFSDDLTRLFNRRFMSRQLDAFVRSAERHGRELSIALVDVDRFKQVNDTYGHYAGDVVLTEIAHRLRHTVRTEDVVGRWGGEEFLVLLPDEGKSGAVVVADKLRAATGDDPIAIPGLELPVTISIGIATREPGEGADQLLIRADRGLYDAKRAGRDAVSARG